MASQRITIVKVGGVSAELVIRKLREWAEARDAANPKLWSPTQFPPSICQHADHLAEQLRAHALSATVLHFVEWADRWSMGDLFARWLTPPDGLVPLAVHADRYEIFAYPLPDGGRLARYLATIPAQQWTETDWYIGRLREAIAVGHESAGQAVVVVLRGAVSASVTNEGVASSMDRVPVWLASDLQ